MISQTIVLQSAGSFSIAVLSFIMTFLQILFVVKKSKIKWFVWSAGISFSSLLYSVGIFLEYNSAGELNRFAGALEFTAIILIIHSAYGFSFSYLRKNGKYFHILAGIFHLLVLIVLWTTDYIVTKDFMTHNFLALSQPFTEISLGPIGSLFEVYGILLSVGLIILWFRHKDNTKYKAAFISGMIFWLILGLHDAAASQDIIPAVQYLVEYGFLCFSVIVLWIVFSNNSSISLLENYRMITEFANDGIIVTLNGMVVFANPASKNMFGSCAVNKKANELLAPVVQEDRQRVSDHFRSLMSSDDPSVPIIFRIMKSGEEERTVEVKGSVIDYSNSKATLGIIRDITERIRKEKALKDNEEKLFRLKKMEFLGSLAGGVAHDLNNVLSGIIGYPSLILNDLPPGDKLIKPVREIQEAGKKAAAIVQDLLTTARGVAPPTRLL